MGHRIVGKTENYRSNSSIMRNNIIGKKQGIEGNVESSGKD
jgi:hypothetical protein